MKAQVTRHGRIRAMNREVGYDHEAEHKASEGLTRARKLANSIPHNETVKVSQTDSNAAMLGHLAAMPEIRVWRDDRRRLAEVTRVLPR